MGNFTPTPSAPTPLRTSTYIGYLFAYPLLPAPLCGRVTGGRASPEPTIGEGGAVLGASGNSPILRWAKSPIANR